MELPGLLPSICLTGIWQLLALFSISVFGNVLNRLKLQQHDKLEEGTGVSWAEQIDAADQQAKTDK
jgi:hypothetical protein